jgi:hypothetical protein
MGEKEAKEATGVVQPQSTLDVESGEEQRAASPGDVGYVPQDNREVDFFTRNGLNLRSFQRRTFSSKKPLPFPRARPRRQTANTTICGH